jgi:ABC-type lipoprotein release transport system permease subunit
MHANWLFFATAQPARALVAVLLALMIALVAAGFLGRVPLAYNVRNLLVRWRTTLLTGAAFVLVTALLVVMLAFVDGMARLTEASGQPANVIVLSEGSTDEMFSNLGFSDTGDIERQPGVARDRSNRPLVSKETYLVVNQPLPTPPGQRQKRRFTQVRGIEDPLASARVHDIELLPGGKWFSEAGVQPLPGGDGKRPEAAIQAVVGEGMAAQLGSDRGRPTLTMGDVFELQTRRWVVVGVMKSRGSTFGSEIWAKRDIVGPMFGKTTYTSIVLRATDAQAAKALAKDLTERFTKAAILAQTETDYFAKLSETNKQFTFAIGFVTVFMAVGGAFGVANTMFAAISARVKDLGVLRILGFTRGQILVSLLLESLLLALVGGAIGCALGSLVNGAQATSIVSGGQGGGKFVVLELAVSLDTLLVGMLLALVMGLVGGLAPAASAMRLRPLESMR